MPSWKDMCEAARATKSWNKTRLQLLFDRRKEVADVIGCNVLMDFVFYFLSFSLASKVFFFQQMSHSSSISVSFFCA